MSQERDERVQGYLARLNCVAELCDLTVSWKCPRKEFKEVNNVSFKERFTMLQLVRGLQDSAIQEWVLQEAASVESGELSLSKVVKLEETAEMGKSSQASISKVGVVSWLSDYRRGKKQGKQEKRRSSQPEVKKLCGSCGRKDHGSRSEGMPPVHFLRQVPWHGALCSVLPSGPGPGPVQVQGQGQGGSSGGGEEGGVFRSCGVPVGGTTGGGGFLLPVSSFWSGWQRWSGALPWPLG